MPGYWHAHSDRDWQDECGMYDWPADLDEHEAGIEADCIPLGAPPAKPRLPHLRHAYARLHQSEDMRLGWLRDIAIEEAVKELRAAGLDGLAERAWDEPLAVMVEVGRLLDEGRGR